MANVEVQQRLSPQQTIDAVVNNVKSEGLFDNFRKECLEEFENLETYHQLKQRVENHVASFLSKYKYHDGLQKNTLRNNLRAHLSKSDVLLNSIQQLVDEVLSLKGHSICLRIDKQVDKYMNKNNECSPTTSSEQEINENAKSTECETGGSLDETKERKDNVVEDFGEKNFTTEQSIVTTEVTEIEEVDMELAENIVTSETQDVDEQLLIDNNVDPSADSTIGQEQSTQLDNSTPSEYVSANLNINAVNGTSGEESISAPEKALLKTVVNNVLESGKNDPSIENMTDSLTKEVESIRKNEKIQLSSFTAPSIHSSDNVSDNVMNKNIEKNSRKNDKIQLSSFIGNLKQPSENQSISTVDGEIFSETSVDSFQATQDETIERSEEKVKSHDNEIGSVTGNDASSEPENESSKSMEEKRKEGLVLVIKTGDIIPPLITEPISDDSASNHSSFTEEKFSFFLDTSKEEATSNRRKSTRVRNLPLKLRVQEERSTKSEDTDSISSNDIDVRDTSEDSNVKFNHYRVRSKRHVLDSSTPESSEARSFRKRSDKDTKKDTKRKRSDSPLTPVEERRPGSRTGRHSKHSDKSELSKDKYTRSVPTTPEENPYKRTRRPVKQRKCYSPS